MPQCRDAKSCEIRDSCPYAKIFEPTHGTSEQTSSPSGLADWPRPFVFRARHLDGLAIAPGQPFHFDLHVFSLDPEILAYFILTFAALAREGLGPGRGKAELKRVTRLLPEQVIYEQSTQMISSAIAPVSLDLTPIVDAQNRIRVDFVSPTELKHEHRIATAPNSRPSSAVSATASRH